MAKFEALLRDTDRFYASVYNGAKRSAERVVADLQQEGPSWTGRFSNSWQISEGDTTVKGTNSPGEPQQLKFPVLRADSAKLFTKDDVVVFSILNTSPHKDLAMDKVEGKFERPTDKPQTQLGLSKWLEQAGGRAGTVKRYQLGGGNPLSKSSRTAVQDWYTGYVGSRRIQQIIRAELNTSVQRLS